MAASTAETLLWLVFSEGPTFAPGMEQAIVALIASGAIKQLELLVDAAPSESWFAHDVPAYIAALKGFAAPLPHVPSGDAHKHRHAVGTGFLPPSQSDNSVFSSKGP